MSTSIAIIKLNTYVLSLILVTLESHKKVSHYSWTLNNLRTPLVFITIWTPLLQFVYFAWLVPQIMSYLLRIEMELM